MYCNTVSGLSEVLVSMLAYPAMPHVTNTVVHKNITYIKTYVANYFLARLQLQLHK